MKNYVERVRSRLYEWLEPQTVYQQYTAFGRHISVREGSLRLPADYDDAWFVACAQHATTLFDVGANIGGDAVLALATGRISEIALVEANPAALLVAADNLIRNGMSANAHFIAAFASDVEGERTVLWTTGTGMAGSMYPDHAVTAAARGDTISISTTTLDALGDLLGFQPDFIKIDVEGAETKVLAGSVRLAAQRRARFLVELHSNSQLPMLANAQRTLEWCGEVGYSAWYLKEHTPLLSAEQISHRGRCHVLLQPSHWEYPEWLRGIAQLAAVPGVHSA
jgi:FkbM family methyltransferase